MLPLEHHRKDRLVALEAEDGWLNLTDRVELTTTPQIVGSSADAQVVLSCGPALLGTIDAINEKLTLPDGRVLSFAASSSGFAQLRVSGLLLELHVVDGQTALRVRDLARPRRAKLCYFPDNPEWIIRARWVELAQVVAQAVEQKGGGTTSVNLTHVAEFSYKYQDITLLATHWKAGAPMFVFRDQTAGKETYAASRFLIGEDVGEGEITLDFNRAYTPPCGFSDFAICPLPPRENILPFRVEAGERLADER